MYNHINNTVDNNMSEKNNSNTNNNNNNNNLTTTTITMRDITTRGYIPYNSIREELDSFSKSSSCCCQFCNNDNHTTKRIKFYSAECYLDEGKFKRDLFICESCLNDYNMRVKELTGRSNDFDGTRLVVADKIELAKDLIINTYRDLMINSYF
jgi:hypothetical protein